MGTEKAGETLAEVWQKGFYAGVNAVRKFANTPNPYERGTEKAGEICGKVCEWCGVHVKASPKDLVEPAESSPPAENQTSYRDGFMDGRETGYHHCGSCGHLWEAHDGECKGYMDDGSICGCRKIITTSEALESKLSVELQALADKDKNEVFYLEQIQRLEERLAACNEGRARVNEAWENTIKERDAEVAKLNGLLERCLADAEKIAERNQ